MKIAVESGKRAPFAFENSKIKVDGSSGLFYNGQISISKDNKVIYAGGENRPAGHVATGLESSSKPSSTPAAQSTVSNAPTPSPVAKVSKVALETLGIDRSGAKVMNGGQKLGISDLGIVDNKLVIEYIPAQLCYTRLARHQLLNFRWFLPLAATVNIIWRHANPFCFL